MFRALLVKGPPKGSWLPLPGEWFGIALLCLVLLLPGRLPTEESLPLLLLWNRKIEPLVEVGETLITNVDRDRYLLLLRMMSQVPLTTPPLDQERAERFVELLRLLLLYPLAQASGIAGDPERIRQEGEALLLIYHLKVSDLEPRLGIAPGRWEYELKRIFTVKEYIRRVVAGQILVSEEEVRRYLQTHSPAATEATPGLLSRQVRSLIFLEKLQEELKKILKRQYESTRFRWFVPPLPEEKLLAIQGGAEP